LKYFKKAGIIAIGAILGFAYYKFIGCRSGVCPLTSNPWISTGYGALIGMVISMNGGKNKSEETQEVK